MQPGKGQMSNFAVEKTGKRYLSKMMKVKVNNGKSC
jgi:hypothetical protein